MAAAPDPDEVLRSTDERANFQRLARLLISGGTSLLREIFDAKCPPSQLPTKLSDPATKSKLKAAKLTKPQRDCLNPSPGVYGKSTDFDITLLFSLLRTICGLVRPATGWDALPASTDHSLTADLARIKYYRNSVYGHVCQAMEITDDGFTSLWRDISGALVRIAGQISHAKRTKWQEAIDKFLNDPLTAEDERNVQELERWYENDKEVKKALEDLRVTTQEEMVGLKGNVQSLETAVREQAQDNKDHQEKLMERLEVALQMIETARQEWKEAQGIKDQLGELHRSVDRLSSSSARSQSAGGKCRPSDIKDHLAKKQEAGTQEVQEKMERLKASLFERLHEIETAIREKKEVQEIKSLLEEVNQLVERLSSLSAASSQSIEGPGTQGEATETSHETQGTIIVPVTTNEPQEVGAGHWARENVQEGGLASTSVRGEQEREQSAEVSPMFTILSEAKEKDARKRQVLLSFYTEVKSFLNKMDERSLTLLQKRMGNVEKNMEQHVEQLKKKEYFLVVAGETSSGKSRLVNLTLREEVLPYSLISNTSTICELKFGEERRIVAHFKNKDPETGLSTKTVLLQPPTGPCGQSYRQQISPYVLFDRVKGSLFKKIELFWPHGLLQKGIVIVDSPGVGESDEMDEMVIQYLPEAFAFIYVIDSANAGGIQRDRLEKLLERASKMPLGVQLEEEAIMSPLVQRHVLSKCTLFVCNKWDQVPKKDMKALKNHVTKNLKKIWPGLDEETQIIYMSTTRASNAQNYGNTTEDVTSLMHRMNSMALKGMQARLEFHWKWLDNLLSRITFQANAFVLNASRNRNEVKQKMTRIVRRLDSIQKQQDKVMVDLRRCLDESVHDAVQRLSEYLLSEDVMARFAAWTTDEVPKEKSSWGETQNEITRVLASRFGATVEQWEENGKVFANSRTLLKQHFQRCYNSFVRHLLKLQFDEAPGISLTKTQKAAIVTKTAIGAIGDTFYDVALPCICGFTIVPLLGLLLRTELDVWIKNKTYRQNKCAFMAKESADLLATAASEKVLRRLVKGHLEDVELCLKQIEARIPELIQADKMLYKQLKVETRTQKEIENIYQPILDEGSQHKGQLAVFGVTEVLSVDVSSEELDWKENVSSYLACGAFSAVYQGTMRGHGEVQTVALKVYDKVHVAETASHVMEEVKLLRELDHPNIVKLLGTSLLKEMGTARAILVMEKCKGNLKRLILEHPESIAGKSENPAVVLKVCQWVKEITAALAYIHERGLIHKGLLLESILLSEENFVKIADIGLCKPAVGAFVGTHVSYMAPELFHSQEYGRKADIYSLGIILWEMWYGQQAFADVPAKTLQDFVGWVDCGNRPEHVEGCKKPPILWENLMKQCWDRNPENRPTAKECNEKMTMLHEEYERRP